MATESEQAAVLAALAGVRKGDLVTAIGCTRLTEACLAASAGLGLLDAALAGDSTVKIVVVGHSFDVPGALHLLAPGGRLVAIAADPGAAARVAEASGLVLRHVERCGGNVAWSAVRPAEP